MLKETVKFIQQQFPNQNPIPLHEPHLGKLEKEYLCKAIDSGFVSSIGPFVDEFEETFSKYLNHKYCIAISNGTSALHLALVACHVQPRDLVITQGISFVATANAIRYCGADPIFLDIEKETLGLCPEKLATFFKQECIIQNNQCIHKVTQRIIKACIPVHLFGHPAKVELITKLCHQWHIKVIEDSAESLGSKRSNQHTGTFGDLGVFSFNGNKIVTAGGGGCIVTQDKSLASKIKHLSTTAKVPSTLEIRHDQLGYNYRMPNVNAALLLAQLEQLPTFLEQKRVLALAYQDFFKSHRIEFMSEPKDCQSNCWLNTIVLKSFDLRDKLLKYTNEHQIMTRPCWTPLYQLPMYENSIKSDLSICEDMHFKILNLPSGVPKNG